ncbi:hypothetical protein CMK11_00800 [Candidatus Poribacteria bacterium]|nr:hypothetical protein [Candidatus Poribacteria bacterium]
MGSQQFPAVWSVLTCDALVAQVLSRYHLDETLTCEFMGAGLNDTYRVRSGASTCYLRVYAHGWRERHDIGAEVELLNHLHRHELPVSYPIATRDGDYIVPLNAYEGVRHAVLFSAAEGGPREENDGRSHGYGRLIAQVHVCADLIPTMSKRFHLDHEFLLDSPLRSLEPFLAHRRKDLDYLADIARSLRARADELLSKEPPEYGICHGDPHIGNLHYRDDGAATLFDFDCFGYSWRALDLAILGGIQGDSGWNRKANANRTRRLNLAIQGYDDVRPLTDAEREAVKVFVPIVLISEMGVHAALAPRHGVGGLNDGYFDEYIGFIRNWIAYYKVL